MRATEQLDRMYLEKIADEEHGNEEQLLDLKAVLPKLREQVKISAAQSKKPVPGGKLTPTKFVQRKNQERYQK